MKLFVNDLTVMDFSYLCPKRGMVGESWIVDIILDGGLNEESMVQDFGIVKKQLKRIIDDYVDHKLVVPAESQSSTIFNAAEDGRIRVDFMFSSQQPIQLNCPAEAYAFVYDKDITKRSLTVYLKDVITTHLPENVHDIEIVLRDEIINTPFYHYTHGLKKHDGNCQRIAHGHKSKITIVEDGSENVVLQQYWADRWADIYIGSKEDIVAPEALSFALSDRFIIEAPSKALISMPEASPMSPICFKYESSQGEFEMAIVKASCEIIEYDSTVECLAQYILEQTELKTSKPLVVRAFEGVGKGAIVSNV
jgi:6-pyruvoyl-tetrahydropterin synthase